MPQESERHGEETVPRAVVLATFDSLAPRTAETVAEELSTARERVVPVLADLVEAGELASAELEDGDDALTAYYLSPDTHPAGTLDPETERRAAVQRTIAELDVPGVSEMMQDWRRDALERAWEFLAEEGVASDREFKQSVFPGHRAGYDTAEAWWAFVRPRLARLPGVDGPGEEGSTWEYDGP